MFDPDVITEIFGSAAALWVSGFAWGKAVAWVRALKNAA